MIDSLSLASHFKPFTRPPSKIIFPVKFHRLSAWDAFTGHPSGRTYSTAPEGLHVGNSDTDRTRNDGTPKLVFSEK